MSQSISLLALSIASAGAIVANRFVTPAGAQAGAAANTLGVARTAANGAGETIPVDVLGTTVVEAAGVIARGGAIETNADGKAVAQSAGPTVARALTAAAADGDLIEALLITN